MVKKKVVPERSTVPEKDRRFIFITLILWNDRPESRKLSAKIIFVNIKAERFTIR